MEYSTWYGMAEYSMVEYGMVHDGMWLDDTIGVVQYGMVQYGMVRHGTVRLFKPTQTRSTGRGVSMPPPAVNIFSAETSVLRVTWRRSIREKLAAFSGMQTRLLKNDKFHFSI